MLLTGWSTYHSIRSAEHRLLEAQANTILRSTAEWLKRQGPPLEEADFEAILEELSPQGLRTVALCSGEGRVLRQVGAPLLWVPPEIPPEGVERLRELTLGWIELGRQPGLGRPPHPPATDWFGGSRPPPPDHRGFPPRPPQGHRPPEHLDHRPPDHHGHRPPGHRPPPDHHGHRPPGHQPPPDHQGHRPPDHRGHRPPPDRDPHGPPRFRLLIQFEASLSQDLQDRAEWTLGAGSAAALVLIVMTLGLLRWLLDRDEAALNEAHAERLRHLGEMSAVLAHEIRNPLASLKGNAQLLEEILDPGKAQSKARRVVNEALRLERLTGDLLEFARAGKIDPKPVDLAPWLEEIRLSVAKGRTQLLAEAAPARWTFDAERIRQVLVNLLDNAAQAGGEDDTPELEVFRDGSELVFQVRDQGPGFPEGVPDRLFEPFYTTRTQGTGLGLAISYQLAHAHGGDIQVRHRPEGGAAFEVRLPEMQRETL